MASGPELPYATALPGCGGRIKRDTDDFQVEEIPLYEPSGQGEHLYLEVEKRGLTTAEVIARIARVAGLSPAQIGHAGLKDAQALTRQWLSLHAPGELPPERLAGEGYRVLRTARHTNKLRPGHLRGNRFTVVIRGVSLPATFPDLLARLTQDGFPNYFGEQRFGRDGENAARGRELVRAGFRVRMPVSQIRFLTNAFQSALFNELVARRIEETSDLGRVLPGDLAVLHRNGAFFEVMEHELAEAQRRAALHELSPSAPLFGYRTPLAAGLPGRWEAELLEREGLTPDHFKARGKRLSPKGERRSVRALVRELQWEHFTDSGLPCLRMRFTLDAGVYATTLLREVCKPAPSGPADREPT